MGIHTMLTGNIDALFATARPHLVRQAHMHGVAPDMVDDVVQETLLEAWRHLEALRDVESFHAWLNGILRNVCLRWSRAQSIARAHQIPLLLPGKEKDVEANAAIEQTLPDPAVFDPIEELNRQDMQVLLDRALAHLPGKTREAIELYYLAEVPQRAGALGNMPSRYIKGLAFFIVQASMTMLIPLLHSVATVSLATFVAGVMNGLGNVTGATIMQQVLPRPLMGRIMGALALTNFGFYPLSVALGGVVVTLYGPMFLFLLDGALIVVPCVYSMVFLREFWHV